VSLTVRFSENEWYDMNTDQEAVTLMATTSGGSFYAMIPSDKFLPARRKQFKEKVAELMQEGFDRGEIEFDPSQD
jgi:hypothetical protein